MKKKPAPYTQFPPEDLLLSLVDTYFEYYNDYVPLLHKPTFQRGIKDNLHIRDQAFGAVVLLVCASADSQQLSFIT